MIALLPSKMKGLGPKVLSYNPHLALNDVVGILWNPFIMYLFGATHCHVIIK